MAALLCVCLQLPCLPALAADPAPTESTPEVTAFPGACKSYCGFLTSKDAPEEFPDSTPALRQTLIKRCRPEASDPAERSVCQCCVCVVASSSDTVSGLPEWLAEPVSLFRKAQLGPVVSSGSLRELPESTRRALAGLKGTMDRLRGAGPDEPAPLDALFDGDVRDRDFRDSVSAGPGPGAPAAGSAGRPVPAPAGQEAGGSPREGKAQVEAPLAQPQARAEDKGSEAGTSFFSKVGRAVGGFFKALFSIVTGVFKAAYRMVRDLIVGPPDPLDEVPLPETGAAPSRPHLVFSKASARFDASIRPFLTGLSPKAEGFVSRTFPKAPAGAGEAPARAFQEVSAGQNLASDARESGPAKTDRAAVSEPPQARVEEAGQKVSVGSEETRPSEPAPEQGLAPRPPPQPTPASKVVLPAPSSSVSSSSPSRSDSPEPSKPAPALVPPLASDGLGEKIYDLLCWGFLNGSQKEVIELARKEVAASAAVFAKYVSPSLTSHLSRIFVDVEYGKESGAAAALRLDSGWSSKWYRVGVVASRFLHTINQTERMISGVLLNLSGLMVQAGAVELEIRMLEVGLQKGSLAPAEASWALARRRVLAGKRVQLDAFMKKFLGTEVDLSSLVGPQDEAYLAAVAKDARAGYLTDERTKRWLAQRVEELLAVIDEQVSRKAALEALKMAMMAEKDLDPVEKRRIIEKFLEVSRSGRSAKEAADAATSHKRLRAAVWESQDMFPLLAEAGTHMRLAQALRDLAVADVAPQLRAGFEAGWGEASGQGSPDFGVHLRWAVTAALRLLWSGEDLDVSKFEKEIARMNLVQAGRDQTYNLERSAASLDRYADKLQSRVSYPDAEDVALYGRARQVLAIQSLTEAPAEETRSPGPVREVASLEDLLTAPVEESPRVAAARLRSKQSGALLDKSRQWFNVEAGFGGGAMVLDSAIPSLVLTLENLGHQEEAAKVRRLGASLREAQRLFETMYAVLHFANDYLYAAKRLEAAQARVSSLGADAPERREVEEELISARYGVEQVQAELHRQFGPSIRMPELAVLERVFSLQDDKLYWGNPLFRQFNMDAQLNEAGARAYEDLVAVKEALDKVPSLRIHLTGLLALVLTPGMPWIPVLLVIDAARTGLPLLSALLSGLSSESSRREHGILAEAYAQALKNRDAAKRLSEEYAKRREALRAMAADMPLRPRDFAEAHQLNRWRIATLAFELSPGAEAFVADRVSAAVAEGDSAKAAALWRSTNAALKLESGGDSAVGDSMRSMLNKDAAFVAGVVKGVLDADDWVEAKFRLDSWIEDFRLDLDPTLGGKAVEKIVKGFVKFFKDEPPAEALKALSVPEEVAAAVASGDLVRAYQLYSGAVKAKAAAERAKFPVQVETAGALTPAPEAPSSPSPRSAAGPSAPAPEDSVERRALTKKVIGMVRQGQTAKAQELLASASAMYEGAGVSFDRYYPGLRNWTSQAAAAQAAAPAPQEPSAARQALLKLRSLWLESSQGSGVPVYVKNMGRVVGYFRLIPDWDLAHGWSSLTVVESFWDRVNGTSETVSRTAETSPEGYKERHDYSFSGPMGFLGDLRFYAGVLAPMTRGAAWDPFDAEVTGKGDSYVGGSLTQHLGMGFDLAERVTLRMLADGSSRSEYGVGTYFQMGEASGNADITLIRDVNARTGERSNHYRSYGSLGYGDYADDVTARLDWQTDDLYGAERGRNSGEYTLSGQVRLPVGSDPYRTEVYWSGTAFRNREYLTSGRYYRDMYTQDLTYFMDMGGDATRRPDGVGGYAGLRQMLVDGRFGGVGMGYAVQSDPATGRLGQYRTLSYAAPGNRGQIDVINSDDPSVGPLAVQAQMRAGPVVVRAGADASEYTLIVGGASPETGLSAAGRVNVPADDPDHYAVGASVGTEDSSYQVLWAPVADELRITLFQGNWWTGTGAQFDYRTGGGHEDRFRFSLALTAFREASDWTMLTPFAPLAKKIGSLASSGSGDGMSKDELAAELGSAKDRSELASKAGDALKGATERLKGDEKGMSFFGQLASDMERTRDDLEADGRTKLPVSWKPAFADFLQSLDGFISQLKGAEADRLFDAAGADRASQMWAPRIVESLDDVLRRYEDYRRAYRDQIMAIPVSGGADKRPRQIADFTSRTQWFADYVHVLRKEFLEMKQIGEMDEAALREQLTRLYRLKEEAPLSEWDFPREKVHRFLQRGDWLPTTSRVPVRVLENRISRLMAETRRREAVEERIRRLNERSSARRETPVAAPQPGS
ncbi:MAG: hypothetical protein HY924_04535 [Elusimicrobia bacterium]|nr:hypothetical protein [Elusimicrobiota bacterium]